MSALTQLDLPLNLRHLRGKTLNRGALMALLDLAEYQLDALLSGPIPYALNIATAGADRAELRVPWIAYEAYCAWYGALGAQGVHDWQLSPSQLATRQDFKTLDAHTVTQALFGKRISHGLIRVAFIHRALGCKSEHVYNLIAEGSLAAAKQSTHHRGRSGSGLVPWDALLQFITQRRVL